MIEKIVKKYATKNSMTLINNSTLVKHREKLSLLDSVSNDLKKISEKYIVLLERYMKIATMNELKDFLIELEVEENLDKLKKKDLQKLLKTQLK